jgi:hypothetical protein
MHKWFKKAKIERGMGAGRGRGIGQLMHRVGGIEKYSDMLEGGGGEILGAGG